MSAVPIPPHLAARPWYPRHVAWAVMTYGPGPHQAPDGVEPVRAVLRGADLRGADLRGADLRGADLHWAVLRGADLHRADLHWAVLRGADLRGADLHWAVLRGADLRGAVGIASTGPVGHESRTIYAVRHDGGPMIQAGCWWGTVPDTIERIERDYAGSPLREAYIAAVHDVAARAMGAT